MKSSTSLCIIVGSNDMGKQCIVTYNLHFNYKYELNVDELFKKNSYHLLLNT
jgi:hypothetical protein